MDLGASCAIQVLVKRLVSVGRDAGQELFQAWVV